MNYRFLSCVGTFALAVGGVMPAFAQEPTASADADDEIVVTGTPPERYYSRTAGVADRLGKDILDIPRSVESIPEQLLSDQHIRELSEIYRYSPNVVNSDGYGGTREDYIIRGFRRRDDVYRDGVRLKTNNTVDPSTISSVEILKGPSSDIGQMTPGGLVNYITRKPQLDDAYRAEVNVDSKGERQAFFDATGGLGGGFAYRFATSYENGETFRDFSDQERVFAYGALSWTGDDGASAGVTLEYGNDDRTLDRGIVTVPVTGTSLRRVADVPASQRFDAPFAKRKADYTYVSADAALPLGSGILAEAKYARYAENASDVHTEVAGISAANVLTRYVQGNDGRDLHVDFVRLQLRTGEPLGPIKAVVGAEYRRQSEFWINYRGPNQVLGTVTDPLSELLVNNGRNYTIRNKFDVSQTDYGAYAVVDITPIEQVTFTFGARYQYYKGAFDNGSLLTGDVSKMDFPTEGKFTKSAAIAWKPAPLTTIYANYSDTFQPQSYYDNSPLIFPSQNGRMWEAGIKQALFNNGLLITAAVFDIAQDNVVEAVNGIPMLSGGQTSKGAELGVVGSPLPGLNIRGGIGYSDAKSVSDNPAQDGNLPTNVPRFTASAWISYEVQKPGPLKGLGVGLGVSHASKRYGDVLNTYSLGDYTTIDSSLWYYIPAGSGQIRLTAGVKNIANEKYYPASGGTFRIAVGAPRTVFAGVGIEF